MNGIYYNAAALREGVEGRFRRKIPDEAWRALERAEAIPEALDKGFREEQEDYIAGWIGWTEDEFPNDSPEHPFGSHTAGGEDRSDEAEAYLASDLGEHEKKRAQAYAAHVTRWVSQYQDVWGFREDVLGGRTLRPDEAYAFLASPATRYFPLRHLRAWGTPVVGHEGEVISYDYNYRSTEIDHRVKVRLNPPGVTKTARYAPHWLPKGETTDIELCAYEDPQQTVVKNPNSWPLAYRAVDGFKETVYPWPGSVLSELRTRARYLAKRLGWAEEDVMWLLLTGEAPYLNPLKVGVSYSRGKPATVKLEAAAWVPAEVLAKNFRNIQRQVLTMSSEKLPVRSLEVCHFVEENIQTANEKSVWPDLWKKWNARHPEKRYATYNGFRQAYFRNMPKVIQPYKHPNLKPSPAAQKRQMEFVERLRRSFEEPSNRPPEEIG